jgi:hypothetical protein
MVKEIYFRKRHISMQLKSAVNFSEFFNVINLENALIPLMHAP